MTVKLYLQRRQVNDTVVLGGDVLGQVKEALLGGNSEALQGILRPIAYSPGHIHDVHWLKLIASYTPEEKGTPVREWAPWMGLRTRLENIDTEEDCVLVLTDRQADLIWNRLADPKFKLAGGLSPQFAGFVMDFCAATGRHFENVTDDLWPEAAE